MKRILFLTAAIALVSAIPASLRAGAAEKITICHVPPGNPANVQVIVVGPAGAAGHLANHPLDTVCGVENPDEGGN